jgi:hypothetical protein
MDDLTWFRSILLQYFDFLSTSFKKLLAAREKMELSKLNLVGNFYGKT